MVGIGEAIGFLPSSVAGGQHGQMFGCVLPLALSTVARHILEFAPRLTGDGIISNAIIQVAPPRRDDVSVSAFGPRRAV